MMLILVMAFFMLGCRFSCSGMKEDFATANNVLVVQWVVIETKLINVALQVESMLIVEV